MRQQILLSLVLTLLFAADTRAQNQKQSSPEKSPNILLIVVDDLGYADFGPFSKNGSAHEDAADSEVTKTDESPIAPNIAQLANAGMVFSQAYTTAPVCSPSRVGLMTGKNQFRWDKPASWGPGLPDSVKTIAEYLKTAGYDTARIGKNDLGRNFHKHNVREYPLDHGYDHFLGFCAHGHDYWLNSTSMRDRTPDPRGTSAALGPLMHDDGEKSFEDGYLTDIFSDAAIDYIKTEREQPFFLTLSYSSVHHLIHEVPQKYLDKRGVSAIPNYDPDAQLTYAKRAAGSYAAYYDKYSRLGAIDSDDMRKFYLANLDCLDDNIGRVLAALEASGQAEQTLIIFISDNGGSPLNGSNNAPLTGGKYSLWEGGIRVPLSLTWRGKIEPGSTYQGVVSAADVLPTAAAVAGIDLDDEFLDGVDLLNPASERELVWKWQKTWAIRVGDWKLTNSNENHWKSEPSDLYIAPIVDDLNLKLFNVERDPGERHNLAGKHPEKVTQLQAAYEKWTAENVGKF